MPGYTPLGGVSTDQIIAVTGGEVQAFHAGGGCPPRELHVERRGLRSGRAGEIHGGIAAGNGYLVTGAGGDKGIGNGLELHPDVAVRI